MGLTACAINCSLKRSGGEPSSTDRMIGLIASELSKRDVHVTGTLRLADFNILAGVTSDEGAGDDWPEIRRRILEHDVLIFGTPIWLGQMSSIAKRVLERMDAFLGEIDGDGRMPSYSKTAVLGIVGNEDGAHAVTASVLQALNDEGWTIPAGAACYWVGEAMNKTDFKDLPDIPEVVERQAAMLAANAAHLAQLLKSEHYPGAPQKESG